MKSGCYVVRGKQMHFIRSGIGRKRGHTNKMAGRWQGPKHLESGTVVASLPGYTSDSPSTFVRNTYCAWRFQQAISWIGQLDLFVYYPHGNLDTQTKQENSSPLRALSVTSIPELIALHDHNIVGSQTYFLETLERTAGPRNHEHMAYLEPLGLDLLALRALPSSAIYASLAL